MANIFSSMFDTTTTIDISIAHFLICMVVSLLLGIFMAKMYVYKTKCSKSFVVTLAMLPVSVCMVIMMVNGNIGAGVAVAGAFSLVRFRSMPGTAKEIVAIFTAMCAGLTVGMGYIGFAILFAVISCLFSVLLDASSFGEQTDVLRTLHVTIPENLNYTHVFDDIFKKYMKEYTLISAKTTNMGSMFKLNYEVELIDDAQEKDMIDELRCRNGNLEIMLTKHKTVDNGL